MDFIVLIVGFVVLVKGADIFVDGASNIATFFKIPPLLIGLTLVAFGTSSPEAAVSIIAGFQGNGDIALGNVIGSNIFNIAFTLGVTALISPLKVERETLRKEIPFTLLSSFVLFILMFDQRLQGMGRNFITRGDGLILLCFFSIFIYYIFEVARHSREKVEEEPPAIDEIPSNPLGKPLFFTVLGLAFIIMGGQLVVQSSSAIALQFGMSQRLVGLTIVALGTSLPELITSIVAALKKQSEIAVGNIIGSNIFNILFIVGASATLTPLKVEGVMLIDAALMIIVTVLLFFFSKKESNVSKGEGLFLFLTYLAYMGYIILRN